MSAADQNPQRILSKRLAFADSQNACLKSELARQRALTADLVYAASEKADPLRELKAAMDPVTLAHFINLTGQ